MKRSPRQPLFFILCFFCGILLGLAFPPVKVIKIASNLWERTIAHEEPDTQGEQIAFGDALEIGDHASHILALSTPKYSRQGNARIYLIHMAKGKYRIAAQTPQLPAKYDPQGVAVYGNELIVANHQGTDNAIVIYNLGAAFKGELQEMGRISHLPRPTSLLMHENRLYVACYGAHDMRGQGLYVYRKNPQGQWALEKKFLYEDMYGYPYSGPDNKQQWPGMGPIGVAIHKGRAYIANQPSSSIGVIDLQKPPQKALLGQITGPQSRLYYPLGLAVHEGHLYVADHLHDYIVAFTPPSGGKGDAPAERILQFPDDASRPLRPVQPYSLMIRSGLLVTSSNLMSKLFVYDLANPTAPPDVLRLPDHAIITSLAGLDHAKN